MTVKAERKRVSARKILERAARMTAAVEDRKEKPELPVDYESILAAASYDAAYAERALGAAWTDQQRMAALTFAKALLRQGLKFLNEPGGLLFSIWDEPAAPFELGAIKARLPDKTPMTVAYTHLGQMRSHANGCKVLMRTAQMLEEADDIKSCGWTCCVISTCMLAFESFVRDGEMHHCINPLALLSDYLQSRGMGCAYAWLEEVAYDAMPAAIVLRSAAVTFDYWSSGEGRDFKRVLWKNGDVKYEY